MIEKKYCVSQGCSKKAHPSKMTGTSYTRIKTVTVITALYIPNIRVPVREQLQYF